MTPPALHASPSGFADLSGAFPHAELRHYAQPCVRQRHQVSTRLVTSHLLLAMSTVERGQDHTADLRLDHARATSAQHCHTKALSKPLYLQHRRHEEHRHCGQVMAQA